MTLTFEKSEQKKRWRDQTFCVLGAPKLGKSELFAAGEGSLFLDIEGGLNHLSVTKLPKDRPFIDWDELIETTNELLRMKLDGKLPNNIDTIILDTATRLTSLASAKTVDLLNSKFKKDWETIEEINLGGDKGSPAWSLRTNLVDALLGQLRQLNCAVVIIAHMEAKKVTNDQGVSVDKQTIDIGGQLGKGYLRYSDHILNIVGKMGADGIITRTVRALPSATIEAGSRGLCIPDGWQLVNPKARSKEAMQKAAKENYTKLRSFFTD